MRLDVSCELDRGTMRELLGLCDELEAHYGREAYGIRMEPYSNPNDEDALRYTIHVWKHGEHSYVENDTGELVPET